MQTLFRSILAAGLAGFFPYAYAATLSLSSAPIYLASRADPNVMIDLSIETPMVGAAYNDQNDIAAGGACNGRLTESGFSIGTCYLRTSTYLGYFDPNKCYTYGGAATYFVPAGATINTNHECTGKWSGNFLNWATMTAIDEFRWALTGGHRSTDTSTLTVLQRANQTLGRGHSWMPLKRIGTTLAPGNINPSTVTPYTDATLYIFNHDTRFDVGTTTATSSAVNFNAQVQACSSTGLESNCTAYGTSNKPEGLIQKNWNKMRFAAVSYLLDSAQTRGGGVLRSKMKYTGPQKYVLGSGMVTNTNAEWSSTTGIFVTNPDPAEATASTVTSSGVINYINQFGANGYKNYDPAGELYYEALRYFKNLGPTPEYSSGLTAAMRDGFPVITTWDDPIQYSCQKNFIVGINDANPWLDKKLPGTAFMSPTITNTATGVVTTLTGGDFGQPSNADTSINVRTLTNTVGDLQGLTNTSQCVGGTAFTYNSSATNKTITGLGEVLGTCPFTPKQNSYYIAGLAYYANTQDIRPDLSGKQTISTYMIDTQEFSGSPLVGQMNPLWLAAKYGGFNDKDSNNEPNLDTEWDTDNNGVNDGVPNNYVLASEPGKLVTGLNDAFSDITSKAASSASVGANSTFLAAGSFIYQAKLNSGEWYGELLAYPISALGNIGALAWNAGTAPALPAANSRVIMTYNPTVKDGTSFRWTSLDASQQALIQGADTVTVGQNRLNYLRGDASNEGTTAANFRQRPTSKLGDIVNSAPQYVGAPLGQYDDTTILSQAYAGAAYASFRTINTSRTPVIYVGANDGMLHGFNATTGAEVMAYVPSKSYDNLRSLSLQNYSHKYFVDGSPTVADAEIGGIGSWKTVLVGGMNSGGRGVYALDVTAPSTFSESSTAPANTVLWEFTNGNDADVGFTYSKPMIVKMNNGKWAAIFGNGYNASGIGATGEATLYILFIEDGIDGTWGANDWLKITTKAGSVGTPNGLASVNAMDIDSNGTVDFIYAGDLLGNMWKFDVSNANKNLWGIPFGTVPVPKPLYTACTTPAT